MAGTRNPRTFTTIALGIALLTVALSIGAAADQHCDTTVPEGESIQAAVDSASDGDTICVEDGTYEEQVEILNTPNLTIVSLDGVTPTVTFRPDSVNGQPTLKIDATGTTVDGFNVVRQAHPDRSSDEDPNFAQGIRVSASNTTIQNNVVEGENMDDENNKAIMVLDGSSSNPTTIGNILIQGNEARNFEGGIGVVGAYGGSIQGVTVQNNLIDNNRFGMVVAEWNSDSTVSLSASDFTSNSFQANGAQFLDFDGSVDLVLDDLFPQNDFDQAVVARDGSTIRETMIFTSIQDAIEAAETDDTVEVHEGTYAPAPSDRVAIDTSGVTLAPAAGEEVTIRFEHDDKNPGFPVIDVLADDVRVEGFTLERVVDPNVYDGSTRHAQGVKVGGFGATGGSGAEIVDNEISFVGTHADNIVTYGVGIIDSDDGGAVTGVTIQDNTVSGFENGVGVFGIDGPVGASLTNNTIQDSIDVGLLTFRDIDSLTATGNSFLANAKQVQDDAGALDLDAVLVDNDFDQAVVVRENPISVPSIFASTQDAVDAASAGETVQIEPGTYEEQVRIRTPDVTVRGTEGATIRADSALVDGKNHQPTVQVAADGLLVEDLTVERVVDDEDSAGTGHTKALGVSFDRSGDKATAGSTVIRNMTISLVDETGEEDFGNAVWVSNFNAYGGERASIELRAENLDIRNDAAPVPSGELEGFGGAAVAVYEHVPSVEMTLVESTLESSARGVYVSGQPDVRANYNDLSLADTAFAHQGDGELLVPYNYYANCEVSVEGDVHVDPVLTTAPADLLPDPLTEGVYEYSVCAEIPADSTAALSTPGPQEQPLIDIFESFDGLVYFFDEGLQQWVLADGTEFLQPMEPVLVVTGDEPVTAELSFPNQEPAQPTERFVFPGWNFVGPRTFADAEIGFSTATVDHTDLIHVYDEPNVSMPVETTAGAHYAFDSPSEAPMVSPFTGFFVYANEFASVPGTVTTGPTHAQFYDAIGMPTDAVEN